ncbi:MAG: PAAR domain-containing protein [Ralstonia sp.]|nr:MAG: PAAR domain-containing protein [Ralstonia sp.]
MRRRYVKQGDLTTAKGVIQEGMPLMNHQGTPIAFLGARVYCPACKSYGYIAPDGPHRPDNIGGQHAALEGDLCICKCSPPPRTVASQEIMFQRFSAEDLVAMGFGRKEVVAPVPEQFDDRYVLRGTSGRPLANVGYAIEHADGRVERGTTDAQGHTHLLRKAMEATRVRIYVEAAE